MAVKELRVAGYRSIRDLRLELGPVNVVVGPNASGKTNLYRALFLLHAAARGELAWTLASEGGMRSVLWAGARKKGNVRVVLGVSIPPLRFEMACGLPGPPLMLPTNYFPLDPEVKEETLWGADGRREYVVGERKAQSAFLRDGDGARVTYPVELRMAESLLSQLQDRHRYPLLSALREEFLAWRFYHHFRTDAEAPMRQVQVGVQTPVLAHDGRDLAAALATIIEIGDQPGLAKAIDDAFPGATLGIEKPDEARFAVTLQMPGLRRPLAAGELSDGTLRYLSLLAALMSPRPPALLALNEPETSLHPDLIDPLAGMIAAAARQSQILVTTHSERLAERVATLTRTRPVRLEKVNDETQAADA